MKATLKDWSFAIGYGFVFSATNLYIHAIQKSPTLSLDNVGLWLLETLALTIAMAGFYFLIHKLVIKEKKKNILRHSFCKQTKLKQRNFYLTVFILHLIFYIPYFLAYYPGLFCYDVYSQITQHLTTHHPLVHTLTLQFFYYLGGSLFDSHTIGIAIASVLQMLIFIGAISFMHTFLRCRKVPRIVRFSFIIWTLTVPFFSILSISMTKDVIFSVTIVLMLIFLYLWNFDSKVFLSKRTCFFYIVNIICMILFRNNGIYIIALTIIGLLLIPSVSTRKLLSTTIIGLLTAISINWGLKQSLNAIPGSNREVLAVPLQQLAYVYNYDNETLEESERKWIEERMPRVSQYYPYRADYVKKESTLHEGFRQLGLNYTKILIHHPVAMVNAFLLLNSGNFYILDHSNAEVYGYGLESRQGFLLTDTKDGLGVEHRTLFPSLEILSERLFSANEYFKYPLLFIACSPAVYFWLILLLLSFCIHDRLKQTIPLWLFVLPMLLTIVASPCSIIRYALPYILSVPILLAAYIEATKKKIQ